MADTGWLNPTTCSNVDRDSKADVWNNPSNASAGDTNYTDCDVTKDTYGDWLYLQFTITTSELPSGATVDGFYMYVKRYAETNVVQDSALYICDETGAPTGNNKASGSAWGTSAWEEVYYGGVSDLWGWTDVVDSEVRDADFGLKYSIANTSGPQKRWGRIDHVQLKIYYTSGGTPVNKDMQAKWDISQLVNKDIQAKWDMLEFVNKDMQAKWDIFSEVNKDLQAKWDIYNLANKDIQAIWDMEGVVGKDMQAIWDILNFVNSDLQVKYDIFSTVAQELQAKYDIDALAYKEIQSMWDINNLVNKDMQLKFDIYNLVFKELQSLWDIEATPGGGEDEGSGLLRSGYRVRKVF